MNLEKMRLQINWRAKRKVLLFETIRDLSHEFGTQKEVAKVLGVSTPYISQIQNGKNLTDKMVEKLLAKCEL